MTKIKYNSDKKNTIVNNLNNIIDNVDVIINNFNNVYIPYDYYYKTTLVNLKYELKNINNNLKEYKYDFTYCSDKICKNELEILSNINKIDDVIINKL